MAGALLPKNNAKNDGDWVPKRSLSICVRVANITVNWFFSSMTLQPSGPPVYFTNYTAKEDLGCLYFPKRVHFFPVLIRKGQQNVSPRRTRQVDNFYRISFNTWFLTWVWYEPFLPWGTLVIWVLGLRSWSMSIFSVRHLHCHGHVTCTYPLRSSQFYGGFLKWGYPVWCKNKVHCALVQIPALFVLKSKYPRCPES